MKLTPSSAPFLDSNWWAEAAGTTDALRTLVRSVARVQAFAVFFAVCNKPWERDQLIAMLVGALPGKFLHLVELTAETTDVLAEVCRQVPQPQGPVQVVGLERIVPSDATHSEVLAALNLHRPQWPERVPQPVIFWVPQYVLGFLEREAPDFFDWRSDTIAFPDLAEEVVNHLRDFIWKPTVDGSLSMEARKARTLELQARLQRNLHSDDPVARSAKAGWLEELGSQLAFSGDWEQALAKFQEALNLYEALGDKRSRAVTLSDIARIRANRGEVDTALLLHQEALAIFAALGDDRSRSATLDEIALIKRLKGEVDAALLLHQQAVAIYEALGDKRSRAASLGEIARIRADKGEVDAALLLHQQAIAIYEALGDKRSRAASLGEIARIRANKGEVDAALLLHQEALAVFEAQGDTRSRAVMLNDIARIKRQKGELDAALLLHQEAITIYKALGDKRSRAVSLGDIARIRADKGEMDTAMKLQNERLAVNKELGDLDGIAAASFDLAEIEIRQKKLKEAHDHLAESYAINLKIGRLDGICFVGLTFGLLLCATGQRKQGLVILHRSRKGFLKLGRTEKARQTQALIDQISKRQQ